jgi:cytidylate kinase
MKEKGLEIDFEDILEEIASRDRIDQERAEAPLKIAPEALIIDTTAYTLEESIKKVLEAIGSEGS